VTADNPRIDDLRRRVQKDPASIAFAQLAEEYRRAGQYEDAVDVCRSGLALHPTYLSARVTLGRALIELGQLDDARQELATVLRSAPENLAAIRGVAETHQKQGSLAEALKYFTQALALARNDPELEQTVADLARTVAPQPRAEPEDRLSLEQMQRELTALVPVAPMAPRAEASDNGGAREPRPEQSRPATPDQSGRADSAQSRKAAARAKADKTVAALEGWLEAIHGARADRIA
jgi:tetratricopeptide (TPR) repeat protein